VGLDRQVKVEINHDRSTFNARKIHQIERDALFAAAPNGANPSPMQLDDGMFTKCSWASGCEKLADTL
jgi:hypothetical protein